MSTIGTFREKAIGPRYDAFAEQAQHVCTHESRSLIFSVEIILFLEHMFHPMLLHSEMII